MPHGRRAPSSRSPPRWRTSARPRPGCTGRAGDCCPRWPDRAAPITWPSPSTTGPTPCPRRSSWTCSTGSACERPSSSWARTSYGIRRRPVSWPGAGTNSPSTAGRTTVPGCRHRRGTRASCGGPSGWCARPPDGPPAGTARPTASSPPAAGPLPGASVCGRCCGRRGARTGGRTPRPARSAPRSRPTCAGAAPSSSTTPTTPPPRQLAGGARRPARPRGRLPRGGTGGRAAAGSRGRRDDPCPGGRVGCSDDAGSGSVPVTGARTAVTA